MFKPMVSRLLFVGLLGVMVLAGTSTARAAVLDLSLVSASGSLNGALFSRFSQAGQGSGNFTAFVRIQGTGHNSVESGYNTDGAPQLNTKPGPFTHSVQFSQVPFVDINGTKYVEFILDAADKDQLSLDKMEFYLLDTPDVTSYPFAESSLFSLGEGNSILLDNVTGNGKSDMYAYIPASVFAGDSDPYLYLYASFSSADGSFEEFSVDPPPPPTTPTPEPASMALFGAGLMGMGLLRKMRRENV